MPAKEGELPILKIHFNNNYYRLHGLCAAAAVATPSNTKIVSRCAIEI